MDREMLARMLMQAAMPQADRPPPAALQGHPSVLGAVPYDWWQGGGPQRRPVQPGHVPTKLGNESPYADQPGAEQERLWPRQYGLGQVI